MKAQLRLWLVWIPMVVLAVSRSWASPGWFWQNPLPQGNILTSVSVDANTVIAVGDAGTVMKTTDGGATWPVQHSTNANTRAISIAP